MKRIISCLLIIVMLAAAIPASAAATTARLVLDAPYGVVGQELEVKIRVEDIVDCGIFGMGLKYDQTVLKPIGFISGLNVGHPFSEEMEKGAYSIAWMIEDLDKPLNGDVVFGTLKFKVLKKVHSVELKVGNVQIAKTSDSALQPVTFENAIVPLYTNHPFTDVKNEWFKESVLFAYNNNLMNGMGENKFEPEGATTRAMLATILYRYEGEPLAIAASPFEDLTQVWYRNAVNWAFEKKIVQGTSDTTFAPDANVTREQIATMLYRYAGVKKMDVSQRKNLTAFPDGKKVSDWAKTALEWAYAEGLITGNSINGKVYLDPQGVATRAQIATILMRFIKASAEK